MHTFLQGWRAGLLGPAEASRDRFCFSQSSLIWSAWLFHTQLQALLFTFLLVPDLAFNPKIHLNPIICFQCNNGLAEVPVQKQGSMRIKCHPSRTVHSLTRRPLKALSLLRRKTHSSKNQAEESEVTPLNIGSTDLLEDTISCSHNSTLWRYESPGFQMGCTSARDNKSPIRLLSYGYCLGILNSGSSFEQSRISHLGSGN